MKIQKPVYHSLPIAKPQKLGHLDYSIEEINKILSSISTQSTIDTALDDTSSHAVTNAVITKALQEIYSTEHTWSAIQSIDFDLLEDLEGKTLEEFLESLTAATKYLSTTTNKTVATGDLQVTGDINVTGEFRPSGNVNFIEAGEVNIDTSIINVSNDDNETLEDILDGKAKAVHSHSINDVTELPAALEAKQDTLVSGTNIKTVNGNSLLGEGDIEIQGGADLEYYHESTEGDGEASITTGHTTIGDTNGNSITIGEAGTTGFEITTSSGCVALYNSQEIATKDQITTIEGEIGGINTELTSKASSSTVESLSGQVSDLAQNKADKATTLSGYGITDAYTTTQTDSAISTAVSKKIENTAYNKVTLDTTATQSITLAYTTNTEVIVPSGVTSLTITPTALNVEVVFFVPSTCSTTFPTGTAIIGSIESGKDYSVAILNGKVVVGNFDSYSAS